MPQQVPLCTHSRYCSHPHWCVKAQSLHSHGSHLQLILSTHRTPDEASWALFNSCQFLEAPMGTRDTALLTNRTHTPLSKGCPSLHWYLGLSCLSCWSFWPDCQYASEQQPCPPAYQPGVIQGGCCFPLPSSNTFFQAFQKVKTSHLCFLLPLSESPHTRRFITKWNKNLCVT